MALDSELRAVSYQGNGSTSLHYEVTFPFLEPSHIFVRVRSSPSAAWVVLTDAQFTVHTPDGAAAYVTTATAYADTYDVELFRWLPYTQPVELPENGRLPAASLEDALDRLTMLAMQSNPDGGYSVPGGGERDVASWADATARAAVVPTRAGQLGVQLDDSSIWVAGSTTAGDWAPYPATPAGRVRLAFVADAGEPAGGNQGIVASWLDYNLADFDAVVFGGDNSYNGAAGGSTAYDADWLAFAAVITAEKAIPVYGNHDWDIAGIEALVAAKFPYLPGNKRDYSIVYGGGLVEIFVINSARNTAWTLSEDNTAAGAQYARVAARIASSSARWKLAFVHHPMVTTVTGATRHDTNLAWPCLAGCDAVFAGHVHCSEALHWAGVPVFNASGAVRQDGGSSLIPLGAPYSRLDWTDGDRVLVCTITATARDCVVDFVDMLTGLSAFSASVKDAGPRHGEWSREVWGPGEALEPGGWRRVGSIGRALEIEKGIRCDLEVGSFGTHTSVEILVNNNVIGLAYFAELAKQAYIAPNEIVYSGLRLREGDVISARVVDGPGAYETQAFGFNVSILGRWLS